MSVLQSQVVNGPSRVQYGPHWERTGALLQRSQRDRLRIDHAKLDGLLHQAREALPPSAIHPVQHTVSWLLPPGCLCCDQKALSESHRVIRRPLARLPPCFVIFRRLRRPRRVTDVSSTKAREQRRSHQCRITICLSRIVDWWNSSPNSTAKNNHSHPVRCATTTTIMAHSVAKATAQRHHS